MFKTLRSQLIFSHILPSLIIIPLMGILLVYFLETGYILPRLKNQLVDDTIVIAKILRAQPLIFSDPLIAQDALKGLELESNTRIMIIGPDGTLLESSNPDDADRLGDPLSTDGIDQARRGTIASHIDFSSALHGDIIDVFAPVVGNSGQILGIIRLSYRFSTVVEQIMALRYLIVLILTFGIVSSAVVGLLLALNIARPIQDVTQAIFDLARGARAETLPETGSAEAIKLQRAANHLVSRLRELEQSRRQLLANLVHELGRPLGGLRISIQVLRDGAKQDPAVLDDLLEGMEAETSVLRRVVEDLSHLHDNVIGGLELDLQSVNLSEWLQAVLLSEREAAVRKGLGWEVDIPDNLPSLEIDPQRMAQALGNLVTNAIKYTPKGGMVAITAGVEYHSVWIRVSDTGPGIPPGERDKIFDPFFRGTQKKRIKQGMGLGLSIARDLVEAHQGRIQLDSTPGLGSHFTIWLPQVKDVSDLTAARTTQIPEQS